MFFVIALCTYFGFHKLNTNLTINMPGIRAILKTTEKVYIYNLHKTFSF